MDTKLKKVEAFIFSIVTVLLSAIFAYPVLGQLDIYEQEIWCMIIVGMVIQTAIVVRIVLKRKNCGLVQRSFLTRGSSFLLALALAASVRFVVLFGSGYYIGCTHEVYVNSHRIADFACVGVLDLAVIVMYVIPIPVHDYSE
ncbi:hypothetical protein IKF73_01940 [Candidatus Saccharibacteria bacterium]|nr:hypothetical protein [Candidatus Saccharibacteria bacterium]